MKNRLIIVLFLAVGLFGLAEKSQAQVENDKEVIEVLNEYDAAWNKKDAAAIAEIIAADYMYFTSKGGTWSRQYTLDFIRSPKYILKFAERSEIKTHRTADTVIVESRWRGNGSYDNKEFNDDQRCSLVFTKTGKNWKLLSEHCTQIVSKKENAQNPD